MSHFGALLRELRLSRGISQEKLAEMIEYQRTNLVNIEAGRKKASEEVMKKLSVALNVPYETLEGWKALDEFSPQALKVACEELGRLSKYKKDDVKKALGLVEKERRKP